VVRVQFVQMAGLCEGQSCMYISGQRKDGKSQSRNPRAGVAKRVHGSKLAPACRMSERNILDPCLVPLFRLLLLQLLV